MIMKPERIDYLERLVEGVRGQVKKSYCWYDGEITIPAKWLDADILCDVIEKEVLPELKNKRPTG